MDQETLVVQGRALRLPDIDEIRQLLRDNSQLGRFQFSRLLCQRWDWRDPKGQIRDMACRSMLLKLERRGLIELPPKRRQTGGPHHHSRAINHSMQPIEEPLRQLMPIRLINVREDKASRAVLRSLLAAHHYLGFRDVGSNQKYLAVDRLERPLGGLVFGSAAWKAKARDEWIGWDAATRTRGLHLITNNSRFLILPWVRVNNLASFLLARALERLNDDWVASYGRRLALVETFVDRSRFQGTCYQAANWCKIGTTCGRSRQDRFHALRVPAKDIYVYPLSKRWRQWLQG